MWRTPRSRRSAARRASVVVEIGRDQRHPADHAGDALGRRGEVEHPLGLVDPLLRVHQDGAVDAGAGDRGLEVGEAVVLPQRRHGVRDPRQARRVEAPEVVMGIEDHGRGATCRRGDRRSRRGPGTMNLCAFELAVDDRRVDRGRRGEAARPVATPSGAATMQIIRMSRAPASRSRSSAATALPPVASIGSIIST